MIRARPPCGKIYDSILETIGGTPLVRMQRLNADIQADLCYKLEFFNPLASVKDRIAVAMIEDLEQRGVLRPDGVIVEPTSGNTGIGLAFAAAAKGYRVILVMPEQMSIERRKIMALLGAEFVLTEAAGGMGAAIAKADEICAQTPNAIQAGQFVNLANPVVHAQTTGPEIWTDCDGKVDVLISGIGTGGTLTGAGGFLKQNNPDVKLVALEPEGSPVLSEGRKGPHKIQGIGAGFIPEVLDVALIDEIITISDAAAFAQAQQTARQEGVAIGISSGAAVVASRIVGARPEMIDKRIVTIIPSFAERYLSTPLFDGL